MSATDLMSVTEQRLESLDKGNAVRLGRAQTKQRVRSSGRLGGRIVADLLSENPTSIGTMYVWQLVKWVPTLGDTKAGNILKASKIDPWRKVGRMTPRMRDELADQIRRYVDGLPASAAGRVALRTDPGERLRADQCRGCHELTRRLDEHGLCGFCAAERAESMRERER